MATSDLPSGHPRRRGHSEAVLPLAQRTADHLHPVGQFCEDRRYQRRNGRADDGLLSGARLAAAQSRHTGLFDSSLATVTYTPSPAPKASTDLFGFRCLQRCREHRLQNAHVEFGQNLRPHHHRLFLSGTRPGIGAQAAEEAAFRKLKIVQLRPRLVGALKTENWFRADNGKAAANSQRLLEPLRRCGG